MKTNMEQRRGSKGGEWDSDNGRNMISKNEGARKREEIKQGTKSEN